MEYIVSGINGLLGEPVIFIYLIFGIFMGMVMGAIPGLTASLAVTLMLPFTYSMTHTAGISLLIALYVGGISGGLISAIAQGKVAAASLNILAKKPDDWSKGMVLCITVEFYAILSLLASMLMIINISG